MTATLFDFNGVLVDDEAVHLAAFREVIAPLGLAVSDAEYNEKYLGFDDAGAIRAILRDGDRAPTDADVRRLCDAKIPIYMRLIEAGLVVFEGAAEIVRRRAALGDVAIVSGALRHEIEHCLGVIGVRDAVKFIVSAEDAPRCKPDPQGYEIAKAQLGDARAVVIEDSLDGIVAAKRAGLRCAAVAHTYDAAALRKAGADVVAARLSELTDATLDAS